MKKLYENYVKILEEELVPAFGCTEPIALAYAGALARKALGALPTEVEIEVSGNILKNVKSVIVPNTGGLKGVVASVASGIIANNAEKKLQVLSEITTEQVSQIANYLKTATFTVKQANPTCIFFIEIRVKNEKSSAIVCIENYHTNVTKLEKNGEELPFEKSEYLPEKLTDRSILNVKDIVSFADDVELDSVRNLLEKQIEYNTAISEEGLRNHYGANVGKILLDTFGKDVHNVAKASASAGSDARMNGCSLPVVIVSGSGNQGLTASLPVIVYAKHLHVEKEKLLRALVLSNLITIHLKTGIGRLSAYCGAVSAGAGAGAGICYLYGGKYEWVAHTIVNALAISSGIICDGAKSSCAAKIASSVEAGILGMEMYRNGSQFYGGDGILLKGVENTIENVGNLARIGMQSTDEEIIKMMIKNL